MTIKFLSSEGILSSCGEATMLTPFEEIYQLILDNLENKF